LDPQTREAVKLGIRGIKVGGETCISCGIEAAMAELGRTRDKVNRMIVLSDGDATAGGRDLPGVKGITDRARAMGVGVNTGGVGVEYNQRILGGIAQQGAGEHYFIEDAAAIRRVFQAEAEKLRATVARDVTASIDLPEGVELDRVFDRPFERRGRRVV